jgi:hypothetical protein
MSRWVWGDVGPSKKYPYLVETLFAWVVGIALILLVVLIPVAWFVAIRESYKASEKGTRRSYRFGWTNRPWK